MWIRSQREKKTERLFCNIGQILIVYCCREQQKSYSALRLNRHNALEDLFTVLMYNKPRNEVSLTKCDDDGWKIFILPFHFQSLLWVLHEMLLDLSFRCLAHNLERGKIGFNHWLLQSQWERFCVILVVFESKADKGISRYHVIF